MPALSPNCSGQVMEFAAASRLVEIAPSYTRRFMKQAMHSPSPKLPLTASPAAADSTAASRHLQIQRLLAFVDQHIRDPDLCSEHLQARFHMSRASLYRLFQSRGGIANYIRDRRLQLAHTQLRLYPASSITWLLYDLGFGSERQFQRAFQNKFGQSPTQWRARCRSLECSTANHPPAIPGIHAAAQQPTVSFSQGKNTTGQASHPGNQSHANQLLDSIMSSIYT